MKKFTLILAASLMVLLSCQNQQPAKPAAAEKFNLAVFIPGVLAGSPIYEKLDEGVQKAAAELPNLTVKLIEGGFNQAQWADQVAALAASGEYKLIVTSNPALPEICATIAKDFPKQKFLVLDGYLKDNPNIATLAYNNRELAYLHGYLAGLIAADAGAAPKVGLIVGQEYPVMNNAIKPGIEEGLKAQNPAGTVEFRVVGNWYDATKGSELTNSLIGSGTSVFIPIAGNANQGVLTAAKAKGKKVLWYDSDGYSIEPSVVAGSGTIRQEKAAYELVKAAVAGQLAFGTARVVGIKDGFVDFLETSPSFTKLVSERSRQAFAAVLTKFRAGEMTLAMPLN